MDLVLNFQPSQKQFEAWGYLTNSTDTEIGYGGAAFGGKSYLGCFWLLAMSLAYPNSAWLMGRKELINLKKTTLLTFFKVCSDYKVEPGKHFTYKQDTNTITFINKSQLFLFDLSYQPSDPLYTRLGGLELTGAFVDEANEVEEMAISILKTRIGRRENETYKLTPKLLETFNPDKGHVYQRYYKPWKEQSLPSYRKFIKALPSDNPYVTDAYINQLNNSDKTTKERLLFGNFEYDDDPATMIDYDSIIDLYSNSTTQGATPYLTCDVARFGKDKTVIGVWSGLTLTQIITREKQGVDVTAELIRDTAHQHAIPFSQIVVDEDGIGGGVVDILRGVKGFTANASPLDGNFQNLKTQCTYKLADMINSHSMAVSCPEFRTQLIEELEQIKSRDADKDGKRKVLPKDEIKAILGRSPDYADMMMMRMYFEIKPKRNGVSQFIPDLENPASSKVHTYIPILS